MRRLYNNLIFLTHCAFREGTKHPKRVFGSGALVSNACLISSKTHDEKQKPIDRDNIDFFHFNEINSYDRQIRCNVTYTYKIVNPEMATSRRMDDETKVKILVSNRIEQFFQKDFNEFDENTEALIVSHLLQLCKSHGIYVSDVSLTSRFERHVRDNVGKNINLFHYK